MRVLQVTDVSGAADVRQVLLPYRDARDKGPYDAIPAAGFWLARLRADELPALPALGCHLVVVLSGRVELSVRGEHASELEPGDVVCFDVGASGDVTLKWPDDAWLFFVSTPGWVPDPGRRQVGSHDDPRPGRPLLTWIRDDDGRSRSEPFRWPYALGSVPPVDAWPASIGAFVTRRAYGMEGYAPGVWHNGPRRQFAITLNGSAENETGDGTVTSPVTGDVALIDDVTGAGHVTRGRGDRWMMFVTVAPGGLALTPEH
ncbi:hypothetical protein GCM10023084_70930 [Streptomyces lacrimifluminis]|uniref:Cupin domain-containing protein n=1 Tax=Streptomyces lacrimifluminis TaxID=1500077 RepID=A0A917L778_9ACTN|nr:hypothetical protein [Streptomyces lacrimifluminis]GGJ43889.1 hypothetical protein GCM10012282_45930 [Streptomyces lacrimifluminis]